MRWALKTFSIEQSDPCIPLKNVDFFDEMRGSDCSNEKNGIEKELFRRKMHDLVFDRKSPFRVMVWVRVRVDFHLTQDRCHFSIS